MKVEVYWNLHKNCFSVRFKGRVIRHANSLHLSNAKFVVRESGRQRVLREGRKNVHAFVRGILEESYEATCKGERVTYNPYKFSTFVKAENTNVEVKEAEVALLTTNSDGRPVIFALASR